MYRCKHQFVLPGGNFAGGKQIDRKKFSNQILILVKLLHSVYLMLGLNVFFHVTHLS